MASGYGYPTPKYPSEQWSTTMNSSVATRPKTPAEIMQQLTNHLLNRGVGFNNHQLFFDELANQFATLPSYPPYDIVGAEGDKYEIRLAIAGFTKDEVEILFEGQVLVISGSKRDEDNEDAFFHKGIASRTFKLSFPLAEYVEVTGATLKDGILLVSLQRELPEELKPKTIKIK